MPMTRTIIEDGRAIYMALADPWSVDELSANYDEVTRAMDAAPGKVHSLIDLSRTRRLPEGVLRVRVFPGWKHPNNGDVIIFGAATIVEVMLGALKRLLPNARFHVCKTEAEARALLASLLNVPPDQPPSPAAP